MPEIHNMFEFANRGFYIILKFILIIGVAEIFVFCVAKYIAKTMNISKTRAIAFGQIICLFLAYFTAKQMFGSIVSLSGANISSTESNSKNNMTFSIKSPEYAICDYIQKCAQNDVTEIALADNECYLRALRAASSAPVQLQKDEFRLALLEEAKRVFEIKNDKPTYLGRSSDTRIGGLQPLYSIVYPGMLYQVMDIKRDLLNTYVSTVLLSYSDQAKSPLYLQTYQDIARNVRQVAVIVSIQENNTNNGTVYKIQGYKITYLRSSPTVFF